MSGRVCFDPGALRHRMAIESNTETTDDSGHVERLWSPVAIVWAAIRSVGARSYELADQIAETATHSITLRYRNDVGSGWQLRLGERIFEVLTARDPDERKTYLVCLVTEEGR